MTYWRSGAIVNVMVSKTFTLLHSLLQSDRPGTKAYAECVQVLELDFCFKIAGNL